MLAGRVIKTVCLAVAAIVTIGVAGPANAGGPTFNCNADGLNEAETTICNHPRLGRLDHQLGDAYKLVFDYSFRQEAELEDVKSSEKAWLRERDTCGSDVDCISDEYAKRIAALKAYLPDDALQEGTSVSAPPATTLFPHPGTSGGGVVRDGPGISYSRVGSLKQGDAISLLQDAGQPMNGYPWFEIQTPDGTIGYQWGGILCANNDPVSGALGTCHALSCPCVDE
ncbi:MAG: SH3 domain-containing protein [Pseudomonadota bacterium]